MSESIINVEKLKVIYNQGKSNEVRSLNDVSVEIYPEEYIVFFGPSGCGKSTLLYSIAGLQAPTSGEVTIDGRNLSKMNKKEKVRLHQTGIGLVFQAFYLIPSLNILSNVCLPKTFMGKKRRIRESEGMETLSKFGITEQAKKFPSELSGGQKQRVAIARSLANDPKIILADEPVGNLDSESAGNVLQILKNLNTNDKKTVILVTHNAEHLYFADRVLYMKDGKIVKEVVNTDKRPKDVREKAKIKENEDISPELRILMRTFKGLTREQIGVLLIPFKAKELLKYVLSDLTNNQVQAAENLMQELLAHSIDIEVLEEKLDLNYDKGGANWNRQRAMSFTKRINAILSQVDRSIADTNVSEETSLVNYIIKAFKLNLTERGLTRFRMFLQLRVESKINSNELRQRLDTSETLGGVGLYKGTAERIAGEIEIILLLRYSGKEVSKSVSV